MIRKLDTDKAHLLGEPEGCLTMLEFLANIVVAMKLEAMTQETGGYGDSAFGVVVDIAPLEPMSAFLLPVKFALCPQKVTIQSTPILAP